MDRVPPSTKRAWFAFSYSNVTVVRKCKIETPPQYMDYKPLMLAPAIKFVYSHSSSSKDIVRHNYKLFSPAGT